jgi:hypothetical protein
LAQVFRLGFETMPPPLNRATFGQALRLTGSRTRPHRYVPHRPAT